MAPTKRCHMMIKDNDNKKKMRKCKNKTEFHFCKKHQIALLNDEYGLCCFCGNRCNPCSQSCGRCARSVSMNGFV